MPSLIGGPRLEIGGEGLLVAEAAPFTLPSAGKGRFCIAALRPPPLIWLMRLKNRLVLLLLDAEDSLLIDGARVDAEEGLGKEVAFAGGVIDVVLTGSGGGAIGGSACGTSMVILGGSLTMLGFVGGGRFSFVAESGRISNLVSARGRLFEAAEVDRA